MVTGSGTDLLRSNEGMHVVGSWLTLLMGVVLGVHAFLGWTPSRLQLAVTKANAMSSVLRAIALMLAGFFIGLTPMALFLAGSWQGFFTLLGWGLALGIYALTGWNPVTAARALLGRSRRRESQDQSNAPNL